MRKIKKGGCKRDARMGNKKERKQELKMKQNATARRQSKATIDSFLKGEASKVSTRIKIIQIYTFFAFFNVILQQ